MLYYDDINNLKPFDAESHHDINGQVVIEVSTKRGWFTILPTHPDYQDVLDKIRDNNGVYKEK